MHLQYVIIKLCSRTLPTSVLKVSYLKKIGKRFAKVTACVGHVVVGKAASAQMTERAFDQLSSKAKNHVEAFISVAMRAAMVSASGLRHNSNINITQAGGCAGWPFWSVVALLLTFMVRMCGSQCISCE